MLSPMMFLVDRRPRGPRRPRARAFVGPDGPLGGGPPRCARGGGRAGLSGEGGCRADSESEREREARHGGAPDHHEKGGTRETCRGGREGERAPRRGREGAMARGREVRENL